MEIHDVAELGDIDRVREILLQEPEATNARDKFEFTPLHAVAPTEFVAIAQELIAKGADVNARNDEGITPLHLVQYPQMAIYLLSQGADVNAISDDRRSVLHTVIEETRDLETIDAVLQAGCPTNLVSASGYTPLQVAELRDEPEKIELLQKYLNSGA